MTRKTASSGRALLVAAGFLATVLVFGLTGAAGADSFTLTKVADTNTTITFTYPQQAGYGYLYSALGTVVSRTNDPTRTQVKFSKNAANDYEVASIVKGTTGRYVVTPPPPKPACSDGLDNDGDTLIDFPADPGCSSGLDNDEFNAPPPQPQCADGIDNDGDGKIDYPADPGCVSSSDNDEADQVPVGNVFLSPSGNDSAACTQTAPCRSLQRGAQVAQPGQTVSLASGTYAGQNLQNVQKAITFQGPAKISDLDVTCTTGVTFKDISATSIGILAGNDNFTVTGGRFGFGTYTRNNENDPMVTGDVGSCSTGDLSQNIVIDGVTIGGYVYPGGDEGSAHPDCLQFYGGTDGFTIRNSTFDGCDDSYIGGFPDFGNISHVLIENNTFSNIEESSSYFYSQWGQPGHPYRCEFITWRGNTVHSNLPLRTECWDMLVENNTFDTPGPGSYNCQNWAATWRAVWRNNTWLRGGACNT